MRIKCLFRANLPAGFLMSRLNTNSSVKPVINLPSWQGSFLVFWLPSSRSINDATCLLRVDLADPVGSSSVVNRLFYAGHVVRYCVTKLWDGWETFLHINVTLCSLNKLNGRDDRFLDFLLNVRVSVITNLAGYNPMPVNGYWKGLGRRETSEW